MDTLPFAVTKIQPPRGRAARLPRPQLQHRLIAAVQQHRLVLLMAPAGGGKTAALAELLQGLAGQADAPALAWVSLDEDDGAQRLLACLIAALDPLDLPWRTAPEALVAQLGQPAAADDAAAAERPASAALRRAVDELSNALAAAEAPRGLIVLDDVHRLPEGDGLVLVDALMRRLPAHWTLLLASRTPPALALARWRASGELVELAQSDLAFSPAEVQALAASQPDAPAWLAEALQRTQGWPAGVQLCLASARGRAGAAAPPRSLVERHLFDYLASEVLDDLPPRLHDFLLRCAVLPELTATRAALLSGDDRAAHWLDEIDRRALFATALEAPEPTWVLHELFRQALLQRLHQRWPDALPGLLRQAAASEPDPLRRIGFLLRAADWAGAEAALDQAAPALFVEGLATEVQRLALQFPAGQRQASARLQRLQGVVACLQWRWADMAQLMAGAVQAAEQAQQHDEAQQAQAWLAAALFPLGRNDESEACLASLRGQVLRPAVQRLALVSECSQHFRRGQREQVPALFGQMVDSLLRDGSLFDWWACNPATSWATVRGMRPLLARYFAGALQALGERPLPMRAELSVNLAFNRLWGGQVQQALQLTAQAEADLGWLACSGETEVSAALLRLIVDAMQGRAAAVWQGLDQLARREDSGGEARRRFWRNQMAIYGVRLADLLGDLKALQTWADRLDEQPLLNPPRAGEAARNPVVRARQAAQLAAHAAPADAPRLWGEAASQMLALLPRLPAMDALGQTIELQLRSAHALWQAGQAAQAEAVLAEPLQRMAEEGDLGHALMCGPRVLAELASARWSAQLPAPWRQALLEMALVANRMQAGPLDDGPGELLVVGRPDPTAASAGPGVVPAAASASGESSLAGLSERETQVLAHIAAGDSNKLIARALDISPHTVKRHVANILDKLGLASRGQAAAWWRTPVAPAPAAAAQPSSRAV